MIDQQWSSLPHGLMQWEHWREGYNYKEGENYGLLHFIAYTEVYLVRCIYKYTIYVSVYICYVGVLTIELK